MKAIFRSFPFGPGSTFRRTRVTLAVAALLPALSPASAVAELTTGAAAQSVLGQPDFTSSSSGVSAVAMGGAVGVAVDPNTGKLFVADGNNRILRFSSLQAYATGGEAEAVFGQADFTSGGVNRGVPWILTADSLNLPSALFVDSAGRLWAADAGNARVLRFDEAATKPTGAAADGVLGQSDLTSFWPGESPLNFNFYTPVGIAGDEAGNIWVCDERYNRVLLFRNAAQKPNGSAADSVLGHPTLYENAGRLTQSGLTFPIGIFADHQGRLWVADRHNNRVLRFDDAANKPSGSNADGVLGQSDFVTATAGVGPATLDRPGHVAVTPDGTLWVSDSNNRRVLGFRDAARKANGAAADLVLGAADLTTRGFLETGAASVAAPQQIAVAGPETLFVADAGNRRVLRFGPQIVAPTPTPTPTPTATPTPTPPPAALPPTIAAPRTAVARNGRVTLRGTSTRTSQVTYRVGARGPVKPAQGTSAWRITLTGLKAGRHAVTVTAAGPGGQVQAQIAVTSR